MKKRKTILTVFSVLLCVAFVLSACSDNGVVDVTNGSAEGESTSFGGDTLPQETEGGVKPEEKPSKYPEGEKLIALTYDDGPYEKTTSRIVDILEANNSVATFFIVGNRINSSTAPVLKDAVAIGCEIANHTHAHETLTKISDSEINQQINDANNAVSKYIGTTPKLLRAPGGHYKGIEDKVPMPFIQWTIDTEDWRNKDSSNKSRTEAERQAKIEEITADVIKNVQAGDIILMHDIYDFTVDLSANLIPKLVEQGYRLVTVSEMFEYYGIELEAGGVYRHARPAVPEKEKITLEPGIYTVNITSDPTLNLRDKVGTGSVVIAEIPNGATVTVLQSADGWSNVVYAGFTGWVSSNYLKPYQTVS